METIRFLSENRPGPRMGMGHAEKMLLQHLAPPATALGWRLEMVFNGRATGFDAETAATGVARTSFFRVLGGAI